MIILIYDAKITFIKTYTYIFKLLSEVNILKHVFHSLILVFLFCAFAFVPAEAETLTLTEKLAKAVSSAEILNDSNNVITATLASTDNGSGDITYTVSLSANSVSVDAASAVSINFDGAELNGITSNDFVSFDKYFTGLQKIKLALPASFAGTFTLSLDKLAELDMSGSSADFSLSIYGFPKIETLKADNCPELKAVNMAIVVPVSNSSIAGMLGGGGNKDSEVSTKPLSSLTDIDISNCPKLDRIGYILSSDSSSMFGGIGGGSGTSSSVIPGLGGSSGPKLSGYKAHSVITTVKDTKYYTNDTSYPEGTASSTSVTSIVGGSASSDVGSYSGKTVNLVPSLKRLNLKDSGKGENDYIGFIDISDMGVLVSAELGGMTRLQNITLPSGNKLTNLNLNGDTALLALDLSGTKGFLFPEGFKTLTGLQTFRMSNRDDVVSVDLSAFTGLLRLEMMNNSLNALDISANRSLEELYVANNVIPSLDVSVNIALRNVDVRNNRLTKIDLSRSTNIRVNSNSAENSSVSLSGQLRTMEGSRPKIFDFRRAGLQPFEFGNIIASTIKGDGINAVSFEPQNGTAVFSSYPSIVEYDYESGIYYEGSSEPLCMNVRLMWNISGQKPFISTSTAEITASTGSGTITPVTITADSYSPVTWTSSPETMPAGLEKIIDGFTFVISGEPDSAYSGTVVVTARNENGDSESVAVNINIVSGDTLPTGTTSADTPPTDTISGDTTPTGITSGDTPPTDIMISGDTASEDTTTVNVNVSSSGGGCNAGFAVMMIAGLAAIIVRKD